MRLLLVVAGGLLLAGAAAVDRAAPQRPAPEGFELTYFPSGRMLGAASLGFDGAAADFAFLRAVQYYGEHRQSDRQYPWAPHLFNIITDLDPRFVTPHVFGALVLAEDVGRLDLALELLSKGMEVSPERWELPFEAGFLAQVRGGDPERAAAWFERARRLPGAPAYVSRFAAFAHARSGSIDEAIRLWREIAETCDEPGIREVARRYVEELETRRRSGRNG